MNRIKALLGTVLLVCFGLPLCAMAEDPPAPWETCVRVRADHGKSKSIGSGTIILSDESRTVVLTAAHVVRGVSDVTVDVFDGQLVGDRKHPKVSPAGSFRGRVIASDAATDVGLLEFSPGTILAASPIVDEGYQTAVGDRMYTVGCSQGYDPTPWTTTVVGHTADGKGYFGTKCKFAPKEGRSGGGLFNADWILAGVCDFAEETEHVGIYAAPGSIHKLIGRVAETGLFARKQCPPGQQCPYAVTPSPQTPPIPVDQGFLDSLRPKRRQPSAPAQTIGEKVIDDAEAAAATAAVSAADPEVKKAIHVIEVSIFAIFAAVAICFAIYQATAGKRRAS